MIKFLNVIFEYVLLVFIVLDYYSVYVSNMDLFVSSQRIGYICTLLLVCCIITKRVSVQIPKQPLVMYLFLIFSVIFLNSNHKDLVPMIANYVACPVLLYIYILKSNAKSPIINTDLLKKYSTVVAVLAAISLFFWMTISLTHIMSTNMFIPDSWSSKNFIESYSLLYFETQQTELFGIEVTRNSGIFEEAPVYNLVLCSALSIELFILEKARKLRSIILIATILSTLTTTGQIFLLTIVLFYMYKSSTNKSGFSNITKIAIPILIVLLYYSVDSLLRHKSNTYSYDVRQTSATEMFNTFLAHPISGVGFDSYRGGINNSLLHLLCECGIFMGIIYLYHLFILPFLYWKRTNDIRILLFVLSYGLCFSVTIGYSKMPNVLLITFFMANLGNNRYLLNNNNYEYRCNHSNIQ